MPTDSSIDSKKDKTHDIVNLALELIDRGHTQRLKQLIEYYKRDQEFDINARVMDEYKTRVEFILCMSHTWDHWGLIMHCIV